MKLFCDNKATISIANNPIQHDRTKHVEIDRHFIKEIFDSWSICIPYIPSSQQVADVLTRGLLRPNFDFCVSKSDLIDIYVPTWRGVLEFVGLALRVFIEKVIYGKFYYKHFFLSFFNLYVFYLISFIVLL